MFLGILFTYNPNWVKKLNWKNTEFSRPQRNRFHIPRGRQKTEWAKNPMSIASPWVRNSSAALHRSTQNWQRTTDNSSRVLHSVGFLSVVPGPLFPLFVKLTVQFCNFLRLQLCEKSILPVARFIKGHMTLLLFFYTLVMVGSILKQSLPVNNCTFE